jgi:peptidoglycan hydrolase-like protein with peptidoglycan-binding domain
MTSHRSSRIPRRVAGVVAATLTLSLLPLPSSSSSTVVAQGPTEAVTGLARGARGEAVRQVQQALVNQGIAVSGGVDGIYGPGTEAAVKQFQQKSGIAASGSVDYATALALGLEKSSDLGLSQGVRSDAVMSMQQKLIAAGHTPRGGADGIFGPATKTALEAFQKAKGIPVTGTVDAATAGALAAVNARSNGASGGQPSAQPAATPSTGNSSLAGLKIGSRGAQVKRVQQIIMGVGFTVVGGADGIYGVLTASAVKSFQNANGLSVTGAVDGPTAALLEQLDGGAKQPAAEQHDPTVSSPFVGLQYGSIGSDVKSLQQALIDAGLALRGGADGVYGLVTQSVVKQFQAKHGLSQSGKVDVATANALASRNPSTSGTTSPLVGLRAGALGNTVKQLQQAMLDAGVDVRGGADGIFGPATAAAVRAFQSSQGLSVTGEVAKATAAALADPKASVKQEPAGNSSGSTGYAKYGEKGARVSSLQSALVKAGMPLRGGVDGDFGGATSAAVMEFQRQKGLNVTGKVDDATATALGVAATAAPTAPDPSTVKMQVFPVQGKCYYGDSFGYNRSGGRTHLGVDIIAKEGNLLYAVADGKISKVYNDYPGSLAGNGVRLRTSDGTYFFYAHMESLAEGIELGVPVRAGQVLGTVGSTGNSGTPHLHLEVHPQGGAAVNPYPLVKAIDACSVTTPLGQG